MRFSFILNTQTMTTAIQPQALIAAFETTLPRYYASLRTAVEQAEGPERLTMRQHRFLQAVARADGEALTTGIARALHFAVPTTTRMLDSLVERGLIERQTGSGNRRQIRIATTSEGIALLARYEGIIAARIRELVSSLDPERQQRMLAAITDLGAALDRDEEAGE
jgi:long-chain acyl-CoA synthetase